MAEGDCCWLGPGVEHACVDGVPCEPGEEEQVRERLRVAAERAAWREAHRVPGQWFGPRHPDDPPLPPAPARRPSRPRSPRIGPPPLPTPGSELLARLEVSKPGDTHGWAEELRGWESIARHAQAMATRAVTGLEHALAEQDRELDVAPAQRDPDAVVDEVARLIQCSAISAGRRVDIARALATRLPGTWSALAAGRTSWGATLGLVETTEGLTLEQAALVEADLWPAKHDHTPGQVLARAKTLIARHAPDALLARAEAAAARREARRTHDPAGGSSLVELEAPAEEIAAFWADVATLVRRTPSDPRPLPEQRLDAIFGAVRGAADEQRERPGFSRTAAARRSQVHITIDVDTLLGAAENPGRLSDGIGAVPAARVRDLALAAIVGGASIERIVTDPVTGIALDATLLTTGARSTGRAQDPASPHVTAALDRRIVARDQTCVESVCDRPPEDCDRDHRHPQADGGPTDEANVDLRCRSHHRGKQHPATSITRLYAALDARSTLPVTVHTSRTGHTWTTRPPDLRE